MPTAQYKRVVDDLASEIRSGRLPAGHRLPTHRQLADREGIAVVTATRVYSELVAMGLVSGEQGRGTFVRDLALPPGHGIDQQDLAADTVDLNFNNSALPGQAVLLRKALRELATSGDLEALLRYQPHRGRVHDRVAVARHLQRRGLRVTADQVLIANGAQHGLAVTAMATLQPGDVVAVDALTYPGFKVLSRSLRVELAPVPVTAHGPDLDALNRLCARRRVRAIYTMPTLHNPLGWVMDDAARTRLIEIARQHGSLIIEDGSYAYLVAHPPLPLAALAPDITVYVTGLSKSVATGLRVGFVAAPSSFVAAIERAIRVTTWNTPALTTTITCGWLSDGTVNRLEVEKRRDARTRQAIAREALSGLRHVGHSSSYFVWLPLAEDSRSDRLVGSLVRQGISVSTAEPFATSAQVPQAIRIALASTDFSTLRTTLDIVRQAVDDEASY